MEEKPPKPRKPKQKPFKSRTAEWELIGLRDQLERDREHSQLRVALKVSVILLAISGVILLLSKRSELFPEEGPAVKVVAMLALAFLGWELVAILSRALTPQLLRRVRPSSSGVFGFLGRLFLLLAILALALRVAGVQPSTLAASGAATVIVLGIAAQGTLSNIFAGLTMLGTRPFRVGERVKLQAGALAGEIEGVVAEQGLFYTTLREGADRIQVPNSVMSSAAIIPLREPGAVDVLASFNASKTPHMVESALRGAITVALRYPPHCALEEIHTDRTLIRVQATPVNSDDGAELSGQVLEVIHELNNPEGAAAL